MKKIALYVHIPFCKSKCLYCDFPSFSKKEYLMESYINALIKEIDTKASKYMISTLFIGGGTPSFLDDNNLDKLLKCLSKLNYEKNAEKTIECNPGTMTHSKFEIMKKYGINRISFGLQSADNNILKEIGRIHSFEEFEKNYKMARNFGFTNINIDMMFGLPGQSVDKYITSLKTVIAMKPEHISTYSLIIEEGTCFYDKYEDGTLILPSEDEERLMYNKGRIILESNGYNQYEISNFSKKDRQCIHNIAYWKCYEYLGVGAYASSFIDNKRTKNISSIEKYIDLIHSSLEVSIIENINTKHDNMEEFMFMGLRMTEGINKSDFKDRFNIDIYDVYKDEIVSNIDKKLLLDTKNRILLTKKGIELSNQVMSDFIF